MQGDAVNAWTDSIQLENTTQAPTAQFNGAGSWTLETESSYTVDEANKTIALMKKMLQGQSCFLMAAALNFSEIEKIQW